MTTSLQMLNVSLGSMSRKGSRRMTAPGRTAEIGVVENSVESWLLPGGGGGSGRMNVAAMVTPDGGSIGAPGSMLPPTSVNAKNSEAVIFIPRSFLGGQGASSCRPLGEWPATG